jgi:thiol-disulfide isomerase/thioredoxin
VLEAYLLSDSEKIIIEVMYKASYCLPCLYMDETVLEILPEYDGLIDYRRIDFMRSPGRERFLEISCELFGEEAVMKHCRVAPVPSLFIDGELFFDAIPPMFELKEAIEEALFQKGLMHKGEALS